VARPPPDRVIKNLKSFSWNWEPVFSAATAATALAFNGFPSLKLHSHERTKRSAFDEASKAKV
jgi:hypothetical protein